MSRLDIKFTYESRKGGGKPPAKRPRNKARRVVDWLPTSAATALFALAATAVVKEQPGVAVSCLGICHVVLTRALEAKSPQRRPQRG